jgi:hypothetical protein
LQPDDYSQYYEAEWWGIAQIQTRLLGSSGRPAPGPESARQQRKGNPRSDIEEDRLVLALDPNVEAVDWQVAAEFLVGKQGPAPV